MKLLFAFCVIFFVVINCLFVTYAAANSSWFREWCERHLIAQDMEQYRNLTVDELVTVHVNFVRAGHRSKSFKEEIKKRIQSGELSDDDREILIKLLAREEDL